MDLLQAEVDRRSESQETTGCPGSQPREMDVAELLDVEESRKEGAADDEKDGKL